MVDKIINPPSQKDLIDKVNELVDDKQDTLVSGTNIKTINGTSIMGSGNIDIQGGSYTAGTGIDITNDVISVEGVKDQRNPSTAIKTWTGTKAQYAAITTKDNDTLYNITDDATANAYEAYTKSETDVLITNSISALLSNLYPVGSIYIGTQASCPLASLISGSQWQLVATDRALWGGNGSNANSTINAGLPNITGNFYSERDWQGIFRAGQDGAFNGVSRSGWGVGNEGAGRATNAYQVNFNASRSSSIYGSSSTVQPPAYVVNIWRRTA